MSGDVSRNRPATSDRQPKTKVLRGKTTGKFGIAVISYDAEGRYASCKCDWSFWHQRTKVVEDAIDRHLAKKHRGRGIRL